MPVDLGAPAAELSRLAAATRDDQLTLPTPCPGIDVAGLLAHIIGLSIGFRDGAAKIIGPTTTTAPSPAQQQLPDDWREQLPLRLEQLAEAWRDPAAWEGESTVGGATMPAVNIGGFGNNELVIHGWDLAVATGQPYHPAEANLQASYQLVSNTPDDPNIRRGLFGRSSSSPTTPPSSTAPSVLPAAVPPGHHRGADSKIGARMSVPHVYVGNPHSTRQI